MLCLSIRVSKSPIRLFLPSPLKNALALEERFDPSTTKMPFSGNAVDFAYDMIALRSSPASSGVKALNSGMIQIGAMNWTIRTKMAAVSQHHSQAEAPAH